MSEENNEAVTDKNQTIDSISVQSGSTLDDAIDMLLQWQMPQLCTKFKEQEVCTIAFQHLTEEDIKELVPKIGPRSIFRANLMEWRKQEAQKCHAKTTTSQNSTQKRNCTTTESNRKLNDNMLESNVVKLEVVDAEEQWLNGVEQLQVSDEVENPANANATNLFNSSQHHEAQNVENIGTGHDLLVEESNVLDTSTQQRKNVYYNKKNLKSLNIKDMLHNCYDGRNALQFYATMKTLDNVYRKKVIKIIITKAIELRLAMCSSTFHDLARQLIELFPNERYETYYVPRLGSNCPKGALYNKYLNMGKLMRKDGILEYRVSRRTLPYKTRKQNKNSRNTAK